MRADKEIQVSLAYFGCYYWCSDSSTIVYYIITDNHSLKSQVQSLRKECKELLSWVNNNKNLKEQLKSLDEAENHMDGVIVFIGLKQKYSLIYYN